MDSMEMQIDELVEQLSPQPGSFGMLSTSDVRELVRKAATKGTLIGYVVGENLTGIRYKKKMAEYQQEYDNLAQHCKDLEMEIMGMKK
jgi:hypothetical protein